MCSHFWNKSIAVSSALAAAGVLTCAAALLEAFMPKGSLAAFLASMALFGMVVTGVVIGYMWVCDRLDNYFHGRLDRILSADKRGVTQHSSVDNKQDLPLRARNEVRLPLVLKTPSLGQPPRDDGHVLC